MLKTLTLKKLYKIAIWVVSIVFIILTTLTILSLLGIPKQLRIFVVETGSMSPTIPAGSLIFDIPQDSYQIGDVITFNEPDDIEGAKTTPITHRINAIKAEEDVEKFETKGDANNTPDGFLITKDDVIGKAYFHIPFVGQIVGFAKTQIGFVILIIIPTVIIIISELNNIKKEFLKLRNKNKKEIAVIE